MFIFIYRTRSCLALLLPIGVGQYLGGFGKPQNYLTEWFIPLPQ